MVDSLSNDQIKLLKIRFECLRRNELFVKECEEFRSQYGSAYIDLFDEVAMNPYEDFRNRWGISPLGVNLTDDQINQYISNGELVPEQELIESIFLLDWTINLREQIDWLPKHLYENTVILIADINQSKQKLMDHFERFLDTLKPRFHEEKKNQLFLQYCLSRNINDIECVDGRWVLGDPEEDQRIRDEFEDSYLDRIDQHRFEDNRRRRDLDQYQKYLRTYDLKMSHSWLETVEILSNEFPQTAITIHTTRDWLKAAQKLIREGIPSLPPFPSRK